MRFGLIPLAVMISHLRPADIQQYRAESLQAWFPLKKNNRQVQIPPCASCRVDQLMSAHGVLVHLKAEGRRAKLSRTNANLRFAQGRMLD